MTSDGSDEPTDRSPARAPERRDWKRKFTKTFLDNVKPPATGRISYIDDGFPGLSLRLTAAGAMRWNFMYNFQGRLRRMTLGDAKLYTIAGENGKQTKQRELDHMQARAAALDAMKLARSGTDPAVQQRKARERPDDAELVSGAVTDYLARQEKRVRASTYDGLKRNFDVDVLPRLGKRALATIDSSDVKSLLQAIVKRGAPVHANAVLANLKAMMNWAVRDGRITRSPIDRMEPPSKQESRDRVLTSSEIKALWQAADAEGWPYGPVAKLLLLTACRLREVSEMRWAELDMKGRLWRLPKERVKNGRAHIIHLADPALAIISALPQVDRSALVFPGSAGKPLSGFSKAGTRLSKRMPKGTPQWSFHDLRRTAATMMAESPEHGGLGIAPHIVDRVLNHSTGAVSGVTAVYIRSEFATERKAALEAWAARVLEIVGAGAQEPNKVIPFRRIRRAAERKAS
jgi:integrase